MNVAGQRFVGLKVLRTAFGAMAAYVAVSSVVVAVTADSTGSTSDVAGAVLLAVFGVGIGYAGLALALERVEVDDDGVHRRNPIWRDRSTPWDQVSGASVERDAYNLHPVVATRDGRAIRLRAAAALLDGTGATPRRAVTAIRRYLDKE